jgi:hypothetical protein
MQYRELDPNIKMGMSTFIVVRGRVMPHTDAAWRPERFFENAMMQRSEKATKPVA